MKKERIQQPHKVHLRAKESDEVLEQPVVQPVRADLVSDLDDILDEIDSVLETNAEEFINAFVQKGGE